MRFTITPNPEAQCFDIRIVRAARGEEEAHHVTTKDLLEWLPRQICSDTFVELRVDTEVVDTPEPRYYEPEAA